MTNLSLPDSFTELEPFVADWALPTRAQRREARLSKPYEELVTFYDAVAPRTEEAIVSNAVNVFKQNRIPDSGVTFFAMVAEPAV